VTDAAFYAGLRAIKTHFEAHRPQVTAYYMQNYVEHPTFVVDVSSAWETKMRAIHAFESQFGEKSNEPQIFISRPQFLEMIEARGKHFGALINLCARLRSQPDPGTASSRNPRTERRQLYHRGDTAAGQPTLQAKAKITAPAVRLAECARRTH